MGYNTKNYMKEDEWVVGGKLTVSDNATVSGIDPLPEVSNTDNGDVLTVVSGAWAKAAPSSGIDYDLVIKCDKPIYDEGVTSSDFHLEKGTYAACIAKIQSGEKITGYLYSASTGYFENYAIYVSGVSNNDATYVGMGTVCIISGSLLDCAITLTSEGISFAKAPYTLTSAT